MKIILRQSLLVAMLFLMPQIGESAASKLTTPNRTNNEVQDASFKQGLKQRWLNFKKSTGGKKKIWKNRVYRWVKFFSISMPTGKLMASLVLLLLSIVLLAIGGVTKYGLIFGILGSVAIIGALVAFLLWMAERSKSVSTRN
jgi:Flp pilus assembly protein TadB